MNQTENNSTKFLPFDLNAITSEIAKQAADELNEGEDTNSKIEELGKLVNGTKLVIPEHNAFLLQFLRPKKFDVKKAFNLMQNFYKLVKANTDIFHHFNAVAVQGHVQTGHFYALPHRAKNGTAVHLFQFSKWNPAEHDTIDMLNCWMRGYLYSVHDPASQVTGIQLLVDTEGMSLAHLRCFKTKHIYYFAKGFKDSTPIRHKGIHIYNESVFFRWIFAAASIFLSQKIIKRFHFHGNNLDSVHKHLPKEILPVQYGGVLPTCLPDEKYLSGIEQFNDRYREIVESGYK